MLARGGMAVVYLVRQPALDRDVVLKRLDLESDDPALAQRFVREARLAATLDHPNVVTLFDFFEHDGVPYIAMEYVSGGSLRELVGRLDLPQLCGVVEGVLAGLGHAERRGIAHRDLKPENVLLTSRGNVKIADFGIARAYNALTQRLTAPGMAIGTPAYMAPEQATNDPLGPYTDLYALGVIAYELLSGRPPFRADTPSDSSTRTCTRARRRSRSSSTLPTSPCATGWSGSSRRNRPAGPSRRRRHGMRSRRSPWGRWGPTGGARPRSPHRCAAMRRHRRPAPSRRRRRRAAQRRTRRRRASSRPRRRSRPAPSVAPASTRAVAPAWLATAAVLAGAAAAAAFVVPDGREPRAACEGRPPRPRRPSGARRPYDFDGDGRQELVIALLAAPRARGAARSGVVLVQRPHAGRPAWQHRHRGARRGAGATADAGTTSARGSRAPTSIATATPTWRSARRPRSACPCSTARRRTRRPSHASSSRRGARGSRPAAAATATRSWRATSTATATTTS